MKKIIPIVISLLISVSSYALFIIFNLPTGKDIAMCVILSLLGIITLIPLFVFIHELGHMVFGLLTGYKLSSFRFVSFEISKNDNNKYRLKLMPSNGIILGQCLMEPPYKKKIKDVPFVLYDLGGLIFSFVQTLIILGLCFIPNNYCTYFFASQLMLAVFLLINNSWYAIDGINDISNLVFVLKNPKYKESILYQLEVVAMINNGKRFGAKTFYNGYYDGTLNHLSIPVVQFRMYNLIDHDKLDEALEYANTLHSNLNEIKIPLQRLVVSMDLIWVYIVKGNIIRARNIFNKIKPFEKFILKNKDTDMYCYYMIYKNLLAFNYDNDEYYNMLLDPKYTKSGELKSVEKRINYLKELNPNKNELA